MRSKSAKSGGNGVGEERSSTNATSGILAILAEVVRADFGYLKRTLELSDGNLGKHLQILETAGMVTIERATTAAAPEPGSPSPLSATER